MQGMKPAPSSGSSFSARCGEQGRASFAVSMARQKSRPDTLSRGFPVSRLCGWDYRKDIALKRYLFALQKVGVPSGPIIWPGRNANFHLF
jgi:hypothetical protein